MLRFLVDLSVNCYSVGLCPDTRHNQEHSIMHGRDESHKTVSVRSSWRWGSRIISSSFGILKRTGF